MPLVKRTARILQLVFAVSLTLALTAVLARADVTAVAAYLNSLAN